MTLLCLLQFLLLLLILLGVLQIGPLGTGQMRHQIRSKPLRYVGAHALRYRGRALLVRSFGAGGCSLGRAVEGIPVIILGNGVDAPQIRDVCVQFHLLIHSSIPIVFTSNKLQ